MGIQATIEKLHYLFNKSDGKIVAHCLDLDLVSSGDTMKEAQKRLNACVERQIVSCYQNKNYSQLIFQAPDSYWREFEKAENLPSAVLKIDIQEPTTTREYAQPFVYEGQLKLEAASLCGA